MKTNSFLSQITSLFSLTSCFFLVGIMPVFGQTSNSAQVQWAPNQENDLAGYHVYQGTVSGQYGSSKDVGLNETYVAPDLNPNKTHYFAITAYDKAGNESIPSQEVYKKFFPDHFPLTINLQGTGTVRSNSGGVTCSSGSCTTAVPKGTKVTLTATPSDGAVFSGWSGACSGTGSCVVVMEVVQQVTATFTRVISASAISNPTPGTTLTSTTVTFTGGHTSQDTAHWLDVGTSKGANNLHNSGLMTSSHSRTVSGLPRTGTIYVRYWSTQVAGSGSGWVYRDHTYTMGAGGN